MNLTTLNDLVWLGFFLGVAINLLMPDWEWKWKNNLSNLLIVFVAWFITEFYSAYVPEPKTMLGSIVYICLFCVAFSFNPLFVYKIITSVGLNIIKARAEKEGDAVIKRETIVKTETETVEKTGDVSGIDK